MILSYESLLEKWVVDSRADKIITIKHNKSDQMNFFLSRDSQELLNKIKENDQRTLLALLRCFDSKTINELRESPQSDDQKDILFDLDDSDALAASFLVNEIRKINEQEKILTL